MSLTGRICLVTGASKGVGRGIAVQLGEAGATVYITGRSVDKLKECAAEIQKRGGKVCNIHFFILNFVTEMVAEFFKNSSRSKFGSQKQLASLYSCLDYIT